MRFIVLFRHSCNACSEVARMVRDTSIAGLEARPFDDPQVAEILSSAGLQAPARPSLLIAGNDDVQLLSGLAMRRRLASVIGWRRSGTIVRLLGAEWRARLTSLAESRGPSRRGVIGGGLAGLAGWVLLGGSASASSRPDAGQPAITAADAGEVRAVLATASVRAAIRTWGPVEEGIYRVSSGGQPTLMLTHPRHGIVTFVDNLPGALQSGTPTALSLGPTPGADDTLRYYTTGGAALADLNVLNGRTEVSAVPAHTIAPGQSTEIEPDISKTQLTCLIDCTGRKITIYCADNCASCFQALAVGGILSKIVSCGQCLACAGPHGISCIGECKVYS